MSDLNDINRVCTQADEDYFWYAFHRLDPYLESGGGMSESDAFRVWLSQPDQIKSDIAFVHKDYDFIYLPRKLSSYEADICRQHCDKKRKCEHQMAFRDIRERLREKLREKACETLRELRAISYLGDSSSESRRNRMVNEIVLLHTSSEMNNIQCISIPFDENIPAYYAISYRWGVHPEWKAQTPNYIASITSISQGNLIKLCKYYRSRIRYMWIDVVCINQADSAHRKMAIKNMDNIYRRAKRIIAVPDLCYCSESPLMEDVTKADIEAAVIDNWKDNVFQLSNIDTLNTLFDVNEPGTYCGIRLDIGDLGEWMEPWNEGSWFRPLDHHVHKKEQLGRKVNGQIFISRIISEWAERAWVVSERIIGVTGKKLLIHILRANAVLYWRLFDYVSWSFDLDQYSLVKSILQSKSTKPIDRLFAILPHTQYKDAVQKLVEEGRTVNDEEDLKWVLFDILDVEGRNGLFIYLIEQPGRIVEVLPLCVQEKEFCYYEETLPYNTANDAVALEIQTTAAQHEKRALKVLLPFIYRHSQVLCDDSQLLDAADGSEMKLIYPWCKNPELYSIIVCHRANNVWKVKSRYRVVKPPPICKYGEFLIVW